MDIYNDSDSYSSRTTKPLFRGTQIIWYIAGLINTLLAVRFILKLLNANPNANFTDFIYSISRPFAAPFMSVLKTNSIDGSILEWTTILAIVVYFLLAMALTRILVIGKTVSTTEAAVKLNNQDK
jgi:uncharacterized protein YggT (Ycf19 family)